MYQKLICYLKTKCRKIACHQETESAAHGTIWSKFDEGFILGMNSGLHQFIVNIFQCFSLFWEW